MFPWKVFAKRRPLTFPMHADIRVLAIIPLCGAVAFERSN